MQRRLAFPPARGGKSDRAGQNEGLFASAGGLSFAFLNRVFVRLGRLPLLPVVTVVRRGRLLFGWRYGITAIGGVTFGGAAIGGLFFCMAGRVFAYF